MFRLRRLALKKGSRKGCLDEEGHKNFIFFATPLCKEGEGVGGNSFVFLFDLALAGFFVNFQEPKTTLKLHRIVREEVGGLKRLEEEGKKWG